MLSIGEFIAQLRRRSQRSAVLGAMYFAVHYESADLLSVHDIRVLLKRARVRNANKFNIPAILANARELVDSPGELEGLKLWRLTDTGTRQVREWLGAPDSPPDVQVDIEQLVLLLQKVRSEDVRSYLSEGIECLRFGALRACVVFLWAGAVRQIQREISGRAVKSVNAAIQKYDNKGRPFRSVDDLAYLRESALLLVAQELGLFDRNERDMLSQALDLRNKCGHPGRYTVGPKKVSAFAEDVISIVFA